LTAFRAQRASLRVLASFSVLRSARATRSSTKSISTDFKLVRTAKTLTMGRLRSPNFACYDWLSHRIGGPMMADSNLDGDANTIDKPSWERAHQMLVGLART
jgi:hypothetical protein